jgi:ketosteroid isomerase-like protein
MTQEASMAGDDLAARVRWLEDIEQLKQLKHRYAAHCDDDYDADKLAPLFTADAVWDGGPMGRYEGREAIREFFEGASSVVPFAIHHVTNPILEVDGDRASGRWYLWQPVVFSRGDQALWMAARYDDVYRREQGQWRFAQVDVKLRMLSPYEQGFAKARMIDVPL